VSWRWIFYVNLPLGVVALVGVSVLLPRGVPEHPTARLDAAGAALLAGATSALLLACIWGGDRYGWGSAEILGLLGASALLSGALVARERRAADPVLPLRLLRTPVVAVASVGLFLATATMFAVNIFVPLFLQATSGASPTEAGLLMLPMMAGITISTTLSGRAMARTGRYKRFPIAGLALMTAALALLAALAGQRSVVATGVGLAVFGLGFGMVSQILVVAVQNVVDRRELGTATAITGFFRALGGAVSAAALGAVFAARAGADAAAGDVGALDPAAMADITGAVRAVLIVAAPLAALALLVVLRLPEVPLGRRAGAPARAQEAGGT
jgi:MFS family permease